MSLSPRPPDAPVPGQVAFVLCELDWMRERLMSRLSCDPLAAFARTARTGTGHFSEQDLRNVVAAVDEAEELLISVGFGLSGLPLRPVEASADDIAEAAARALENGLADGERALHAAGWIGLSRGLRALALSLRENDAHVFWQITPSQLVSAFRAIDAPAAGSIVPDPRVARAPFSKLSPSNAIELADELERAASGFD